MKKKLKRYLVTILTIVLVIGIALPSASYVEAASNHLIIINTKKNTLGYYVNYELVKSFKVATGKSSSPTPTGKTKVVNKIKNRPYYSGGIAGGSPNNPLGDRWLGLNLKGTYGTTYAIHGNNNASSIGKHISGGCVRMHNSEVRWLFDQVPVGADVILKSTDQSDAQIAAGYKINLNANKPGWKKENGKWYYIKEDKNYHKNGWLKIQGKYYYFDKTGVMQTGWKKVNEKWYYLQEDGMMKTGWKKVNNQWYYFQEDGSMKTGWKSVDNNWYYFNAEGKMLTNTTIDGWIINADGIGTQQ